MQLNNNASAKRHTVAASWKKDFKINYSLYLLVLPVVLYYLLFCYKPMYGAIIAFKDFSPNLGIIDSPWVGMKHFKALFSSPDFPKILRNTLTISLTDLVFSFPLPIIFALLLNEVKNVRYKKFIQTATYLPHFISLVVACGMIKIFVGEGGFISKFVSLFTGSKTDLMLEPKAFVPIYVASGIWQGLGWNSIIYLAALSAVDTEQYEAAEIDGAGRFAKMMKITLPSIMPTIVIMLILRLGQIMNVGYEKIILLYNPLIYNVSDVISSYSYRVGFQSQSWSYSTAVGIFNSVINFILVIAANKISDKVSDTSLW